MDTSEKVWESEQLLRTVHQVCQILGLWKEKQRGKNSLHIRGYKAKIANINLLDSEEIIILKKQVKYNSLPF